MMADADTANGNGRNGRRFAFSPSWLAVALASGGVIYQVAIVGASVSQNTRRIDAIEAKNDTLVTAVGRVDTRTARIETTLDMMFRGREYRPLSTPTPAGEPPPELQDADGVPRP